MSSPHPLLDHYATLLTLEALAVNRLSTSAVMPGEVTALEHEPGYHTVEGRFGVAVAVLASGELAEVAGGLGNYIVVELEDDATSGLAFDGDIKLCARKGRKLSGFRSYRSRWWQDSRRRWTWLVQRNRGRNQWALGDGSKDRDVPVEMMVAKRKGTCLANALIDLALGAFRIGTLCHHARIFARYLTLNPSFPDMSSCTSTPEAMRATNSTHLRSTSRTFGVKSRFNTAHLHSNPMADSFHDIPKGYVRRATILQIRLD